MVTVPRQVNGPDHSGNGGWVSGLLAAELGGEVVESTLNQPPPLETPLAWEHHGAESGEVHLVTAGGAVIGSARPGSFTADVPACPADDEAEAGTAAYRGFEHHPFDRCFTCGTAREDGDGLRLFTGPVAEDRVAGRWSPHPAFGEQLDVPTSWAALDCPGGWAADFTRQLMVLGRMTAQVLRAPRAGEPLRSVGVLRERDGRKFHCSTALWTDDGELLGRAEQTWIEVPADRFA